MKLPERLPQLSGRGLAAYRVLWLATFALALLGATLGQKALYERNFTFNETVYRVGLRATVSEDRRMVSPLFPSTAGFAPESRILAVDGTSLPRATSYAETTLLKELLDGPEGTPHRLLLREPEGRERTVDLSVRQANLVAFDAASGVTMRQRLQLYLGAELATALLFLGASAILFLRRAREPVVALLALGLAAEFATRTVALTGSPWLHDTFDRIDLTSLLMGLGLAVFPSGRFEPRWTYLVAVGLIFATLAGAWLADGARLALAIVLAVAVIAANVIRYRRLGSTLERQQVKWATLGIASGVALLLAVNVMVFVQAKVADPVSAVLLSASGNVLRVLALACLVGGLLISLLRYRLYDADAALSRSAAYGGLALVMIAIFAGSEKLIELLAQQYLGESIGFASGAIAGGIAAAFIPLMHRRLEGWAERRFQGPLLALRTRLPDYLGDWRENAAPAELAAEALRQIVATLHTHGGAIVAHGIARPVLATEGIAHGELKAWLAHFDGVAAAIVEDDPLLPVRIALGPLPKGGAGWLLLGPRPDGSVIGKDEREAALAIADPLARALAVAMQRREREARLDAALRRLGERVGRLEARPG